jgi:hypothetical protein
VRLRTSLILGLRPTAALSLKAMAGSPGQGLATLLAEVGGITRESTERLLGRPVESSQRSITRKGAGKGMTTPPKILGLPVVRRALS